MCNGACMNYEPFRVFTIKHITDRSTKCLACSVILCPEKKFWCAVPARDHHVGVLSVRGAEELGLGRTLIEISNKQKKTLLNFTISKK